MILLTGLMTGRSPGAPSAQVEAREGGAVTLAGGGTSEYTIVVSSQASDPEKLAAEDLQGYLKKISGATLPIEDDSRKTSPMIRLAVAGKDDLPDEFRFAPDDAEHDAFIIRTLGKDLYLVGSNERGALYAAYAFLEKHLGCRWSSFGIEKDLRKYSTCEEFVPTRKVITLAPIDETSRAAMKYRGIITQPYFGNCPVQIADWMGKNRMNYILFGIARSYEEAREWRELVAVKAVSKRGIIIDAGHHSFAFFVPPKEYFKEHPEYFALIDGERKPSGRGVQLCLSNPNVADIYVRNVVAFVKRHPEIKALTLFPNDGFGWCECEKCRELAPDTWSMGKKWRNVTDVYQQFMNTVVPRIRKQVPGVKLLRGAYVNYGQAPTRVRLAPRMDVCYALYERAWVKDSLDVLSDWAGPYIRKNLKDWAALLKGKGDLIIYSYYNGGKYAIWLPWSRVELMSREIRYFHKVGATGVLIPATWRVKDACAINSFCLARYCWDPQADPDALLGDYCRSRYGKAAPVMARYFKELESYSVKYLKYFARTPEQKSAKIAGLKRLQGYLDQAKADDADKKVQTVLGFEQEQLDKFKKWQGP